MRAYKRILCWFGQHTEIKSLPCETPWGAYTLDECLVCGATREYGPGKPGPKVALLRLALSRGGAK